MPQSPKWSMSSGMSAPDAFRDMLEGGESFTPNERAQLGLTDAHFHTDGTINADGVMRLHRWIDEREEVHQRTFKAMLAKYFGAGRPEPYRWQLDATITSAMQAAVEEKPAGGEQIAALLVMCNELGHALRKMEKRVLTMWEGNKMQMEVIAALAEALATQAGANDRDPLDQIMQTLRKRGGGTPFNN
jgi:hypothetical protein